MCMMQSDVIMSADIKIIHKSEQQWAIMDSLQPFISIASMYNYRRM